MLTKFLVLALLLPLATAQLSFLESWREELFTAMAKSFPKAKFAKCQGCWKNDHVWIQYKKAEFCYKPSFQSSAGCNDQKCQSLSFCKSIEGHNGWQWGFDDEVTRCVSSETGYCGFPWWGILLICLGCLVVAAALFAGGFFAGKKM